MLEPGAVQREQGDDVGEGVTRHASTTRSVMMPAVRTSRPAAFPFTALYADMIDQHTVRVDQS